MIAPCAQLPARYRVLVEWARWKAESDGHSRVEQVDECRTAGGVVALLAAWGHAPGVVRVWWEARTRDGWRECGRAA